jgi:DNA replication and repair protein RecF
MIQSLEVRGFRNLAAQTISLGERFNVFAGENGQGKTNLLEALYLVATTRSFRSSQLIDCVAHGAEQARVKALVEDEPPREQVVAIVGTRRVVTANGKRPRTLATYALATPVVLFEPASLTLSQGPASERRKLMDRVAVHLAARSGGGEALVHDAERYRRAHLQRKRALEKGADARTLTSFEHVMAEHGARIMQSRAMAVAAIAPRTLSSFAQIARTDLALSVAYAPKGPIDAQALAELFAQRRDEDARRGSATRGPHLDELSLTLDAHDARKVASQGQHRAIVLALKSAELEAIRDARDVEPVLLLDDVSSELDASRNAALFELLHARQGQVVLTTTRPELMELTSSRRDFRVHSGVVRAA